MYLGDAGGSVAFTLDLDESKGPRAVGFDPLVMGEGLADLGLQVFKMRWSTTVAEVGASRAKRGGRSTIRRRYVLGVWVLSVRG